MTDQTPDPWEGVEEHGEVLYEYGPAYIKADVDRALAAERAQHQQEIAELRRQNCDWAADAQHWRTQAGDQLGTEATRQMAEVLLAQRDETIRQLQAEVQRQKDLVLAQTRLGSEAFERAHAAEAQIATLTQERDNAIAESIRLTNAEIEALSGRCATLTAALARYGEHERDCGIGIDDLDNSNCTCGLMAALTATPQGVPTP